MKLVLLFLLAVFSQAVAAQAGNPANPCGIFPPPPVEIQLYIDQRSSGEGFACSPTLLGFGGSSGTAPTVRVNEAGAVAWWYCRADDGKWYPNWVAASTLALRNGVFVDDIRTLMTSTTPLATLNALAKKNINLPLSDPTLTPVWCPFYSEINAGRPTLASWVVAPNGSAPDRAAFPVVDGKRSFSSFSRVPVGTPCDCEAQSMKEGSTTYCQITAAVVSVCVKP